MTEKIEIENLRSGHMVKICNDPSYSIRKHGDLHGYKATLAGTVQKVHRVSCSANRVWIVPPERCGHDEISFHITDLIPVIEKVEVEPEFFNPKQLNGMI